QFLAERGLLGKERKVADVIALYTTDAANQDLLRRVSQLPALPVGWRDWFRKRLWALMLDPPGRGAEIRCSRSLASPASEEPGWGRPRRSVGRAGQHSIARCGDV